MTCWQLHLLTLYLSPVFAGIPPGRGNGTYYNIIYWSLSSCFHIFNLRYLQSRQLHKPLIKRAMSCVIKLPHRQNVLARINNSSAWVDSFICSCFSDSPLSMWRPENPYWINLDLLTSTLANLDLEQMEWLGFILIDWYCMWCLITQSFHSIIISCTTCSNPKKLQKH